MVLCDCVYADDAGFEAYMYWYQPKTNRCFVSVMSLSGGMMKIRLSVEPYEIVDAAWDDLPFGLQIGDGEQAVLKVIEDMVWHYTEFDMGRKLLNDGTYVIMLPGNETLEYIQLRVASMVTLQHFVEEKVPGIYDRLFWHITYHWKSHEIYQDRAAAMNLISETLYEKWDLAEFGNHNVYTMERKIEDVLGDDPVLESELWKVILEEIGVWCYDNLDIGMNTHDKHVTFRYQGKLSVTKNIY